MILFLKLDSLGSKTARNKRNIFLFFKFPGRINGESMFSRITWLFLDSRIFCIKMMKNLMYKDDFSSIVNFYFNQ